MQQVIPTHNETNTTFSHLAFSIPSVRCTLVNLPRQKRSRLDGFV